MTAHDAAVRAVAEAPCLLAGTGPAACTWRVWTHPQCAIAALTTNADVRAGLMPVMFDAMVEYLSRRRLYGPGAAEALVDAVLAALGGAE